MQEQTFLVCGEALYDLFLTAADGPGALSFDARAGGSPFNVSVGIARRGGRSALFTGLSEDMLGERLAAFLTAEGVDTRYLVRSGRRTTLSLVDLSVPSDVKYAFYGLGSADCMVTEADLPALGDEIGALHFGSYSIAVDPVAGAFEALARREARRFISLDPNVRPTVEPDPVLWRARIDALLPSVDLVKVSSVDLEILYPGAAFEEIAARWRSAGPALVVVTDGENQVAAFGDVGRIEVAPPKVAVVDTVGAGDAFQSELLVGLMRAGAPVSGLASVDADALARILSAAAQVAAETCARRGADIPRAEG